MRKKRLSGLPSEHARKAQAFTYSADEHLKVARAVLKSGDCKLAFSTLINGSEDYGVARTHMAESGDHSTTRRGEELASLSRQFRQQCLRKPGLLDRLKRRKD